MILRFTIPGEPVAKGRPRFTRTGRSYNPPKTAKYENLVRLTFDQNYPDWKPLEGGVDLSIRATFPVPKAWSKKKYIAAIQHMIAKITKPDLDNLIKSVSDGLNEVAWKDDAQIYHLEAWKGYGEKPGVEVMIGFDEEDENGNG